MSLSQDLHGSESHNEILSALGGPNLVRSAQLIILAALWNDDLTPQFIRRVKAMLFNDDLLRAIAAYSVGSLLTFGRNDLATIERLLRVKFTDQAVTITIDTIHRLVDLIDASDVEDAIELLSNGSRAAA